MKLRFNDNTLRLRLSQSDLQTVIKENVLTEKVKFGKGQSDFYYEINLSDDSANIVASFQAYKIAVSIPEKMAKEWAESNDIGLYHQQTTGDVAVLSISVEKDFQCLHKRPEENEVDNFPNPLAKES